MGFSPCFCAIEDNLRMEKRSIFMREKYKSNIAYGNEICKKNRGIISPMREYGR
jgi:hypothetical protein